LIIDGCDVSPWFMRLRPVLKLYVNRLSTGSTNQWSTTRDSRYSSYAWQSDSETLVPKEIMQTAAEPQALGCTN
jgi:hypothetical protein